MLSPGECLSNRDDAVGISMRDITDSNSSDQGSLQHRKRPLVQSTIITANDELIEEDIVNEQSQYQLATSSFIDKSISDYDNALVIKNGAQILEGVDVRPERVIGLVDAVVEGDRNGYEQLESEEGIKKYNDNIGDMDDNSKRDGADEAADNNNDVGDNGRRNKDYEHDGVGTGENSNANFDVIDDNDGNHFNGSNSSSAGDCSGDSSGIINNGQSYEGILNGHLICDSNRRSVHDEGDEQISGKGRLGDEMRSCCEGGAEERN
ncbi:unnamed protein product, partial [Anisakis simplex]|uniref:Uncharacterized protein n=1 Tax=Anisakis simplex TaxID=6269 RepID=A0A0M3KBG9_ANISI